ncbi:MAG TPA: hypothetical protein VE377_19990 [Candidatus Dormibacteraeota bacterium]|nr:hypothetical protein [Candidatus Dormibacteraeota bacterium]
MPAPQLVTGNIYAVPRKGLINDGEKRQLEFAVVHARNKAEVATNAMTTAIQRLKLNNYDETKLSDEMWKLLRDAFLIGDEATVQDKVKRMASVQKVLETTRKGLRERVEIVDLPQSDFRANRLEIEAQARKRKYNLAPAQDNSRYVAPKPLSPTGLFGYVRGAFPAVAGRIHLAFGYLFDEKLSTWTVIHEATHKFAGTVDNAYWDDDHNRWEKTISVGKAIKNADSYAKFAMEYKDTFLWKIVDVGVA